MSFTLQNNYKYLFKMHTAGSEIQPSVYERVLLKHISVTSVSLSEVCSDTSNLGMERYHVALKSGHEVSGTITCPTSIQGTFSYTYTGLACSDTSLETCTDKTLFKYNDTLCTDNPMFSGDGTLHCVFTGTKGSYTYVTLYDAEASMINLTNFQFSCMVYTGSTSIIVGSVNPEECLTSQMPASLTSTYGKVVTFTALSTCSASELEEAETDYTWLYVFLGVLALIIIILGIVLFIKFIVKKGQVVPNKNDDIIISKPPARYSYM